MKKRILIVDDEPAIRKTFREILEYEDYTVEEAKDGLDCLVKLKNQDFEFNAIILDIKMPKMGGIETFEKIQYLSPDIPVIMISGHADIDTAIESVRKGAFDFVSKPIDLSRLLIILRNAIALNWEKSKKVTIANTAPNHLPVINIESPSEFKLPFQQYLLYFKEYVSLTKGVDLSFFLKESDDGIMITLNQKRRVKETYNWLKEFIKLSDNEVEEFEDLIEIELGEIEVNLSKYEIEKQIKNFQESVNWIKIKKSLLKKNEPVAPQNLSISFYSNTKKIRSIHETMGDSEYRSKLKKLVGGGKTLEVLQELIGITINTDKAYVNQLLILQSQLNNLIVENGSGKLSFSETNLQRNKIQTHLLRLIDDYQLV